MENLMDVIHQENEQSVEAHEEILRDNPRLVFADPDAFFEREYYDLLMEQQEQF